MPVTKRRLPRTHPVVRPGEALTNSTASDQDYTSIFTVPASMIHAGKIYKVSVTFSLAAGVSSVTTSYYLKLGSTKIWAQAGGVDIPNSFTRSFCLQFLIIGTAAPGASVSVEGECIQAPQGIGGVGNNSVAQPVGGIATNGTLAIVPGVTFSGTGSTETSTLLTGLVEELN